MSVRKASPRAIWAAGRGSIRALGGRHRLSLRVVTRHGSGGGSPYPFASPYPLSSPSPLASPSPLPAPSPFASPDPFAPPYRPGARPAGCTRGPRGQIFSLNGASFLLIALGSDIR